MHGKTVHHWIKALGELIPEKAAREFFLKSVHPSSPRCPSCLTSLPPEKTSLFFDLHQLACAGCGKKFFATTGTIFSGSKLDFRQILCLFVFFETNIRNARIVDLMDLTKDTVQRWRRRYQIWKACI